jgi:SAM-dependent methyltransferase
MDERKMGYRSRLFQHYLTTQAQSDINQIQQDLRQRAPYVRRLIQRWIPENRTIRILDLGCGYGPFIYFLKEAGYRHLKGIDRSPEQVKAARQLGLDSVEEGDALDILRKSENSSYDIVIAFDVLEHLTKQEVFDVVDEVCRVLTIGGKLILHVPNGEAIFSGRIHFGDLTHETGYTRQSIRQLMNSSGFKTIHFAEDVPVVHGVKSGARYVLWKFFRMLFHLVYIAETGDMGRDLVLSQNLLAVVEKE